MKRLFLLLALTGAVLLSVAPLLADDGFYVVAVGGGVGTKITSVPYVIKNPGFYYLSGNLTYNGTGNAITIDADNVTLDLMGFRLANGGAQGSTQGIYTPNGRSGIEVRNGTLSGWNIGIRVYSSSSTGQRIINVRVDASLNGFDLSGDAMVRGCTVTAPAGNTGYEGISIGGTGIVSGCMVKNFNDTNAGGKGILLQKGVCSGNVVDNCYIGIYINKSGSVIGNTVITSSGQIGIYLYGITNDYVMLNQNTVSGAGTRFYNAGLGVAYDTWTNAGF